MTAMGKGTSIMANLLCVQPRCLPRIGVIASRPKYAAASNLPDKIRRISATKARPKNIFWPFELVSTSGHKPNKIATTNRPTSNCHSLNNPAVWRSVVPGVTDNAPPYNAPAAVAPTMCPLYPGIPKFNHKRGTLGQFWQFLTKTCDI